MSYYCSIPGAYPVAPPANIVYVKYSDGTILPLRDGNGAYVPATSGYPLWSDIIQAAEEKARKEAAEKKKREEEEKRRAIIAAVASTNTGRTYVYDETLGQYRLAVWADDKPLPGMAWLYLHPDGTYLPSKPAK